MIISDSLLLGGHLQDKRFEIVAFSGGKLVNSDVVTQSSALTLDKRTLIVIALGYNDSSNLVLQALGPQAASRGAASGYVAARHPEGHIQATRLHPVIWFQWKDVLGRRHAAPFGLSVSESC